MTSHNAFLIETFVPILVNGFNNGGNSCIWSYLGCAIVHVRAKFCKETVQFLFTPSKESVYEKFSQTSRKIVWCVEEVVSGVQTKALKSCCHPSTKLRDRELHMLWESIVNDHSMYTSYNIQYFCRFCHGPNHLNVKIFEQSYRSSL